jgi:hypothetical protein
VKYEEVYLKSYTSVADASNQLNAYFHFYDQKRLHQSLRNSLRDAATPEFSLPQRRNLANPDIIGAKFLLAALNLRISSFPYPLVIYNTNRYEFS